jgi:hypothetical protein
LRAYGMSARLDRDIEEYLSYRRDCFGAVPDAQDINFEDFLAFLDLEYYLGLRGSDTWSDDGNESQILIKTMIGHVIVEATPPVSAIPKLYLRFAELLQPGDFVLTFNYDTLLERSLEALGRKYRLFPNRFSEIRSGSAVIDSEGEREEVAILKMHGSVDWFDRNSYQGRCDAMEAAGLADKPNDPVFNAEGRIDVLPIVEGPRYPDDPLSEIYRVKNVQDLYADSLFFRATPWLLVPSTAKVVYAERVKEFWHGLGQAGGWNLGCGVIGFSLPDHDEYVRQVLWRFIRNYQGSWWDEEFYDGMRKAPVALIDLRRSEAEREDWFTRFKFVDFDKARVDLDGFRLEALDAFFSPRD